MSTSTEMAEVVFTKLSLAYGREFLSRWDGMDLQDVKADWAHELSGFVNAQHAISYALQNLPSKPPTVYEFRAIAFRAPLKSVPRLEAPRASPEVVKQAIARARQLLTTKTAKAVTRGRK